MPKETMIVLRCDRCSNEGHCYTVDFGDEQVKEFILCDKHSGPLEKLRGLDYGEWRKPRLRRRRGIQKINPEDIPRA